MCTYCFMCIIIIFYYVFCQICWTLIILICGFLLHVPITVFISNFYAIKKQRSQPVKCLQKAWGPVPSFLLTIPLSFNKNYLIWFLLLMYFDMSSKTVLQNGWERLSCSYGACVSPVLNLFSVQMWHFAVTCRSACKLK